MTKTVVALFKTQNESKKAVQELVNMGLPQDRIDISKGYMPARDTNKNAEDRDSISQFFDSLFGNGQDSKRLSEVARNCGSIVTVHANTAEEANKAAHLLDQAGAANLDELEQMCKSSAVKQPHQATGQNDQHLPSSTNELKDNTGKSIPVIEEEVQVGKREVETGGVRVRSRIVERPVEEKLRLRQEHVIVERNQMDRPATDADFKTFKEGEAEFVEHKEVPVVNKEAKVVEEVRIGKEVDQRQQVIRETEKKTEVDVEQLNSTQQGNRPYNK